MNEERQREQLHKLLDIVIDGNGFERRQRGETGTLPTLFFEFTGHINRAEIRLCKDGWQTGSGCGYREFSFNLCDEITDANVSTIRAAVNEALADKTESDILRQDIAAKEKELAEQKREIANMKKALRKAMKKEGVG